MFVYVCVYVWASLYVFVNDILRAEIRHRFLPKVEKSMLSLIAISTFAFFMVNFITIQVYNRKCKLTFEMQVEDYLTPSIV